MEAGMDEIVRVGTGFGTSRCPLAIADVRQRTSSYVR
jgi:hypothetical protein